MAKVIFFGPIDFKKNDAGSNRVIGVASIFKKLGWEIECIGKTLPEKLEKGIVFKELKIENNSLRDIFFRGKEYYKIIRDAKPDLVISYGNYIISDYYVYKKIEKNKFVVDIVEWYSKEEFKNGRFNKSYIKNNLAILFYKRIKNKIVISKYLKEYYYKNNTIVLPPIIKFDEKKQIKLEQKSEKLKLVYAGMPGRKDYLFDIIEAIGTLNKEIKIKVSFDIYGLDSKCLKKYLKENKKEDFESEIGITIFPKGRIKKNELEDKLKEYDFLIFTRPNLRYAKAGFPSKVPEALSLGIPIMTNLTSDLEDYLLDDLNSIILKDNSIPSIKEGIEKATKLTYEKKSYMSKEAFKTAKEKFHYNKWVNEVKEFLNKIDSI